MKAPCKHSRYDYSAKQELLLFALTYTYGQLQLPAASVCGTIFTTDTVASHKHMYGIACRVMTVSFHRYGQLFFPGTGSIDEIGFGAGKHYTLNIPFESGLTDSQFWNVFQPVMQKVMDVYQPGAVVLQCGGSARHPSLHPIPSISPCMHACMLVSLHPVRWVY